MHTRLSFVWLGAVVVAVACGGGASRPASTANARASLAAPAAEANTAVRSALAEEPSHDGTPAPLRPHDINHVLVTGQSLAVGVAGAPALSLSQPFGNLMFNTG